MLCHAETFTLYRIINSFKSVSLLYFIQQNEEINQAACDLAKGVAQEGGVYCAGSICQTASLYTEGAGKQRIQKRFEEQIQIFLRNDMDLLIAEVRYDLLQAVELVYSCLILAAARSSYLTDANFATGFEGELKNSACHFWTAISSAKKG